MATTLIPILMAITHTPIVIMAIGRGALLTGVMVEEVITVIGVRATEVMVEEVIMVIGVRVTGVTGGMAGIADNTFFGHLHYDMM